MIALTAAHRPAIAELFLSLPHDELCDRFCHGVSREWVARYVERLAFDAAIFRGIFEGEQLVAMSELQLDCEAPGALEFATVVRPRARRKGYAALLIAQAKDDAWHAGATQLTLRCLLHNRGMVRTAQRVGIIMRIGPGGLFGQLPLKHAA